MVRLSPMINTNYEDGDTSTYAFAEEARQIDELKLDSGTLKAHAIQSEFAIMCRSPVDGTYVIPSAYNPNVWFGMLFVRRGEYCGAIFRFQVKIPDEFPDTSSLPRIRFDNDVFHPNVDLKSREVDMSRYFPDGWKKDKHHVVNCLVVLQRIFFSLDVPFENAANAEAALLWKEQKDKFRELVRSCVNTSRAHVYDDPPQSEDPNAILVTPWDPSVHEQFRQRMMLMGSGKSTESGAWSERGKSAGYSWVDTERMTYMTEPRSARDDDPIDKAAADRAAHGIERLDLSGVSGDDEEPGDNTQLESVESEPRENGENGRCDLEQTEIVNGVQMNGDGQHSKLHRTEGILESESGEMNEPVVESNDESHI